MKVLIVGAGIGGLTTALMLHRNGVACEIYEQTDEIKELGVGVNILPHAIRELADLGLLERLDQEAIRTKELIFLNRFGQLIWREPRGVDAGYDIPQFSIHRGRLQSILLDAVRQQIGGDCLHPGHRLTTFEQTQSHVVAHFSDMAGAPTGSVRGDVLIGADGIHSTVRTYFRSDEGPPSWNGLMIWRGATVFPAFLSGRSMVIAGDMQEKIIIYPIARGAADMPLTNWALTVKMGDGTTPPPRREDWNRAGLKEEILPHVQRFDIPFIDARRLVEDTPQYWEYPMCDRDPLETWTCGRVTLLGDAAHPMYPVGSNGASQAILDARALTNALARFSGIDTALAAYENDRRPKTSEIVRLNRIGGPERVVDVVSARAPQGFTRLEDVIEPAELATIARGYANVAGFTQEQVNRGKQPATN